MNSTPDKTQPDTLWRKLVEGRLITGSFFLQHWLTIVMIIGMVLLYITTRYSCQHSMERIRTLSARLEVVETESLRVKGQYMSRIRESEMRQRLDSMGLPLSVQMQPPYHLSTNGNKKEK